MHQHSIVVGVLGGIAFLLLLGLTIVSAIITGNRKHGLAQLIGTVVTFTVFFSAWLALGYGLILAFPPK